MQETSTVAVCSEYKAIPQGLELIPNIAPKETKNSVPLLSGMESVNPTIVQKMYTHFPINVQMNYKQKNKYLQSANFVPTK